jgi:hypothetical protein
MVEGPRLVFICEACAERGPQSGAEGQSGHPGEACSFCDRSGKGFEIALRKGKARICRTCIGRCAQLIQSERRIASAGPEGASG